MSVAAAFLLCHTDPAVQKRVSVRGWFMPSNAGSGYVAGDLFNDRHAVPVTTVDQWDVNGNWRRYGALYVRITTQASIGPRSLRLHGRLDCVSYRFLADRDPFPPAHVTTVYGTARGGRTGPVTTWASAGGLKLMLTVPQRSYPRNALTRVTVSIQNVSRHTVGYWVPGVSLPGVASPQAEVLDRSGHVVFPPAMPFMPALPGPAPFLAPLHPGQTIRAREYVVVRGTRIRASQSFTPRWGTDVQRAPSILVTQPITMRLTHELPPHLSARQTASGPVVDVFRPLGVTGQLLWLNYADCGFTNSGFTFTYTYSWVDTSTHLTPGCVPLGAWHFRIAVLNHPVAAFDYTAPQPTPAAPPSPVATTATATATSPASAARFADLLNRADHAMAFVHMLHATGIRSSVDPSGQMRLRIQADCRSRSSAGIPITARTLVTGRESQAVRLDEGYLLAGPVLHRPHAAIRVWRRSPVMGNHWRVIDVYQQWRLDRTVPDPVWSPNPAYLNQVCPDLIRLTYLNGPLPSAQPTVLGRETVGGHQVWDLREHLWFTLNLFVDAHSFRLYRLVLSDRPGPTSHWEVRFDYSRFNAPVDITTPTRGYRGR